jgi:hypothetical protein
LGCQGAFLVLVNYNTSQFTTILLDLTSIPPHPDFQTMAQSAAKDWWSPNHGNWRLLDISWAQCVQDSNLLVSCLQKRTGTGFELHAWQ